MPTTARGVIARTPGAAAEVEEFTSGDPGPGPPLSLDLQRFFDPGGSLRVSWYGDCLPTRDFPLLANRYRQGQLKLDEVVTRTISLDETEEAFAAMERGETLRSAIVFGSEK